jgi:hypothetical protein
VADLVKVAVVDRLEGLPEYFSGINFRKALIEGESLQKVAAFAEAKLLGGYSWTREMSVSDSSI